MMKKLLTIIIMWMCAVNASGQEDYSKLDLLVGDIPKIIYD